MKRPRGEGSPLIMVIFASFDVGFPTRASLNPIVWPSPLHFCALVTKCITLHKIGCVFKEFVWRMELIGPNVIFKCSRERMNMCHCGAAKFSCGVLGATCSRNGRAEGWGGWDRITASVWNEDSFYLWQWRQQTKHRTVLLPHPLPWPAPSHHSALSTNVTSSGKSSLTSPLNYLHRPVTTWSYLI